LCRECHILQEQLREANLRLEQLEQEKENLLQENALQQAELVWFREQNRLAKQRQFGHSKDSGPEQLALFHFNEAEQYADLKMAEPVLAMPEQLPSLPRRRGRKQIGKRQAFWDKLPKKTTRISIPEEERLCSECGTELHKMSEEVRRELRVIPAQFWVEEIVREVYVCQNCVGVGAPSPIVTAVAPIPPIEKSFASASLLAYIADMKYSMGLPLNRITKMLNRMDLNLNRQNLPNWMIQIAELWLKPLYDEMHRQLLQRSVLHSDETHIQVLREPGRKPETKSSMWIYTSAKSDDQQSIILYDYQETKAAKWPKSFLDGFSGYLHVDGASSYEAAQLKDVVLVACLSHARRGFMDTLKAAPKGVSAWGTHAARGVEFCDMLFDLEREYDTLKLTHEERHAERLLYSKPVMDAFYDWLLAERPNIPAKFLLGKAVAYCLNQWPKLVNFLLDGRLEISNNRAERAAKAFVMGRSAWLFSNSPRGADASAVTYSVIETAAANNLKPFDYLKWLLEEMPQIRLTSENLQVLLPWSPLVPQSCKILLHEA